ncbi:MAG: PAS domain S-box protein [Desulfobacterales bacterium]|nr:PAS domain S-box protein [Desulfobacterales bacterium]
MFTSLMTIRHRLVAKLILTVGLTLLLTISGWAYFNIKEQKQKVMANVMAGADRLTNTIRLGAHYAMMTNARDDINQIIQNIARQKEIEAIRIYNKEGEIKFSNRTDDVERRTNIKAEACDVCHRSEPPLSTLSLSERTRVFTTTSGGRFLGVLSPIPNEPGCAADACHVHPEGKQILGALDVVTSLAATDREIHQAEQGIIRLAVILFVVTSTMMFLFVLRFVNRPVNALIEGTRRIAKGNYASEVELAQDDEMGLLARAINQMGREIGEKQSELNKQRDEYQTLFERVPCLITVQDRSYKLIKYNQEFAERFAPRLGDYCYHAYKGREEKCENCPVERTFEDGLHHYSEETGVAKNGEATYWIVRSTPIKDEEGEIIAAMEISLDVTPRKRLEEQLETSEQKYYGIFNNIPNPVFMLDADGLEILDCNESVNTVYGYTKKEMMRRSFMDLFKPDEREEYTTRLGESQVINQVKHAHKDGREIFVTIRVSPMAFPDWKALLVTISDITKRLEAEQQLIQASKMATLGEMATGVAHELNQPLSVIKTVSSFCMKKIDREEPIAEEILVNMLGKVDANVDRASRIINHMRQFARKSDLSMVRIRVEAVMESAFEIFSQQLKVREIEVAWDLADDLPRITADPGRLEQVFINLLINARDAIEQRWADRRPRPGDKRITLAARTDGDRLIVEVDDTGAGIPKEIADKVFEPFFTTKEVGKGTGLGLSISYGIVKDCRGEIRAGANEAGGARFTLVFPVNAGKEPPSQAAGRQDKG